MNAFIFALDVIALIAQIVAIAIATSAYRYSGKYRASWILVIAALIMMGLRRIHPIFVGPVGGLHADVYVLLGALLSIFMAAGIAGLRKILIDLDTQNKVLSQFVQTDSLTGILSRSEALSRAEQEIARSRRKNEPLSFVMMDIDHFKRVNDQYGHAMGDRVLAGLAETCHKQIRNMDIFGRVGGEEFLFVFPDTPAAQAKEVSERIRLAVAKTGFTTSDGRAFHITVSLGVAEFYPSHESPHFNHDAEGLDIEIRETFFNRADAAMYLAKQTGRNRVCIWAPPN